MTRPRTSVLRPFLAAVLVLVLSLAGIGRGWADAPVSTEVVTVIGGVVVPICHAGPDENRGPTHPGSHDCCDTCALWAPATLPGGPDLAAPALVSRYRTHTAALGWAPTLVRLRTPRLSQGPPTA